MKRRIMKLAVLAVGILITCTFAFASEAGRITAVEGRVDILQPGQNEAQPLEEGGIVSIGDIIRTKSASKVEITFADNTILKLAQSTRIEIKNYQLGPQGERESAVLNIERGKVRAIVSKSAAEDSFIINTPNASGSVKGTDLYVIYQKSSTGIVVLDGKVSVANISLSEKPVEVASGDATLVSADQPPATPRAILAMEKKGHEADTSIVRQVAVAEGYSEPEGMRAVVVKVSGGVRIRSRGALTWHDAKINEVLSAGDSIQTQDDGKIEIKLDNNNAINLKPNSILVLQKLSRDLKSGDYENLLESNFGKIRAKVEKIKGKSRFEIKTPTAIACVRGTIMYLDIQPDSTTSYFEEGDGFVTNTISGDSQTVPDGTSSTSDNQGNISEPTPETESGSSGWQEGWDSGGSSDSGSEGGAEGYSAPEPDTSTGDTGDTGEDAGGTNLGGDNTLNTFEIPFNEVPFTETNTSTGTNDTPAPPADDDTPAPEVDPFAGTWGDPYGDDSTVEETLYYNNNGYLAGAGSENGIMTAEKSPWNGGNEFSAEGGYYYLPGITESMRKILNAPIASYNETDYNGTTDTTTPDGRVFYGFTAGTWFYTDIYGSTAAIYLGPNGDAGFLRGGFYGDYYSDGIWKIDGHLWCRQMAEDLKIDPAVLKYDDYIFPGEHAMTATVSEGSFGGTGSIAGNSSGGETYFIKDNTGTSQSWGIYNLKLGGEANFYNNPYNSKVWVASISGTASFGNVTSQGFMSGDVYGTFGAVDDEGNGTWSAVSLGEWHAVDILNPVSNGVYFGFIGGGLWESGNVPGKLVALYAQPGEDIDYDGSPFSGASVSAPDGEDFGDIGGLGVASAQGINPHLESQPWWGVFKLNVAGDYDSKMADSPFKITMGGEDDDDGYWIGIAAGIKHPESDLIEGSYRAIGLDVVNGNAVRYYGDIFGAAEINTWKGIGLGEWETPHLWQGDFETPEDLDDFINNYIDWENPIITGDGYGSFGGSGEISDFNVTGRTIELIDQGWGLYYISFESNYDDMPQGEDTGWSVLMGGEDTMGDNDDYWIVKASGGWDENSIIGGGASGHYLSDETLGTIEGDSYGRIVPADSDSGTIDTVTVGTWKENLLAFGGSYTSVDNPDNKFGRYDAVAGDFVADPVSSLTGLFGGTQSLWADLPELTLMGKFSNPNSEKLFATEFSGSTFSSSPADEGRLLGTIVGVDTDDKFVGRLAALYIRPVGDGGYLAGYIINADGDDYLDGNFYPKIGMFEVIDSELTVSDGRVTSVSPDQLFDGSIYVEEGNFSGRGSGSGINGSNMTIEALSVNGRTLNITDQTCGIWDAGFGGTYTGDLNDSFRLALGGTSADGFEERNSYWLGTLEGNADPEGAIAPLEGRLRGVWFSFGPADGDEGQDVFTVGRFSGGVVGTEGEVDTTWQAIGAGEWVELATLDFGTEDNIAFNNTLAQMVSVPVTETYASLLQGTGNLGDSGTITNAAMDISFYASASDTLSGIWAALFNGNYTNPDGAVTGAMAFSDNAGTTANLTNLQWNQDNTWHADVNGNAPSDVAFSGQAGGTYTGTETGTFEGVGAGTWTAD